MDRPVPRGRAWHQATLQGSGQAEQARLAWRNSFSGGRMRPMPIRHLFKWEVAFDFALAILRFYVGGCRKKHDSLFVRCLAIYGLDGCACGIQLIQGVESLAEPRTVTRIAQRTDEKPPPTAPMSVHVISDPASGGKHEAVCGRIMDEACRGPHRICSTIAIKEEKPKSPARSLASNVASRNSF